MADSAARDGRVPEHHTSDFWMVVVWNGVLGYPAYFATILGIWKVLGAVALLTPRYPRVKEWAYAGMFIDYTAAVVSYVAVGVGSASTLSGPVMSVAFLAASWALRPPSRISR